MYENMQNGNGTHWYVDAIISSIARYAGSTNRYVFVCVCVCCTVMFVEAFI